MSVKDPGPLRLIGTLSLAGFCAGVILVGIYLYTAPIINQNRAEALNRAIMGTPEKEGVLAGTKTIKSFIYKGDKLEEYDGEYTEDVVYAGYDEAGNLIGYAVRAEGPGFADTIKLVYGFDPKKRAIIGFDVLESKETPGLGDKVYKDAHFLDNFVELMVDPKIEAVKPNQKTKPNHVDTISGATISSKAVVAILNASMNVWKDRLAPQNEGTQAHSGETRKGVQ